MTLGHPSTGMINAGTSVLQLIDSPALFRAVLQQQLRPDFVFLPSSSRAQLIVAIFFRLPRKFVSSKISRGELLDFERRFISISFRKVDFVGLGMIIGKRDEFDDLVARNNLRMRLYLCIFFYFMCEAIFLWKCKVEM